MLMIMIGGLLGFGFAGSVAGELSLAPYPFGMALIVAGPILGAALMAWLSR